MGLVLVDVLVGVFAVLVLGLAALGSWRDVGLLRTQVRASTEQVEQAQERLRRAQDRPRTPGATDPHATRFLP